jgi:hypothetical protein
VWMLRDTTQAQRARSSVISAIRHRHSVSESMGIKILTHIEASGRVQAVRRRVIARIGENR